MYDVDIQIQYDGSIAITETVVYNFGSNQRHGIFRDIPWRYPLENEYLITEISIESVTDENGIPYRYTVSTEDDFINAKIGDPDRTISGIHTYVITYTVMGILNTFEEHDELYWNAIGTGWEVPINRAVATVVLPQSTELKGQCFTGILGSQESSCDVTIQDDRVEFSALQRLSSNEALTVVVGWPKGIVTVLPAKIVPLSFAKRIPSQFIVGTILFVPISTFLFMLRRWWKYGRDPQGRGTIIAEYEPPQGVSPGLVGIIVDQRGSVSEISAMILNLAVSGFIKIKRIKNERFMRPDKIDYELVRKKPIEEIPDPVEKLLANNLFAIEDVVTLSELKGKFVQQSKEVLEFLFSTTAKKGYFPRNPNTLRDSYIVAGVGLFILAGFFAWVLQGVFGADELTPVSLISFFGSGVIVMVFGFIMPRRSKSGRLAYEHILGFKEFLKVTEKDRLKFHNAPEKTPELFSKYLPYAMVLGVYKDWVDQFKDITMPEPSWYEGGGMAWNVAFFSSTLNDLSSSITSNMSQAAGAGSGFSGGGAGGGGGGGGGGSW